MLELLEKAKEEKKKIDERIVRLENELASLENSNAGHQPAAPTQQGHGPEDLLLARTFKFIVNFHLHLIFLFSELISPGSRVEKLCKISHSF